MGRGYREGSDPGMRSRQQGECSARKNESPVTEVMSVQAGGSRGWRKVPLMSL